MEKTDTVLPRLVPKEESRCLFVDFSILDLSKQLHDRMDMKTQESGRSCEALNNGQHLDGRKEKGKKHATVFSVACFLYQGAG